MSRKQAVVEILSKENSVEELFEAAQNKPKRLIQQDQILHHGRIPVRIFPGRLVAVAFEQNIEGLVNKVRQAIKYLKAAQISYDDCMSVWGKSWLEDGAHTICADTVALAKRELFLATMLLVGVISTFLAGHSSPTVIVD